MRAVRFALITQSVDRRVRCRTRIDARCLSVEVLDEREFRAAGFVFADCAFRRPRGYPGNASVTIGVPACILFRAVTLRRISTPNEIHHLV